ASVLLPLLYSIVAVAVVCISHAVILSTTTASAFAKITSFTLFKGIAPAAAVAFSTASSAGTLPVTIKNTHENLGVSNKISSFVLPLGATINMDGTAIYQGVAVVFIAQFYGMDMTLMQLTTVVLTTVLASIGTEGDPGVCMLMLAMVLAAIDLA